MTSPVRIAVIGGGISGLAAAHFAASARPDATVTVYEQSDRIGGKIRTAQLAGTAVDVGAEAILARRPEGLELIDAAGLGSQRIWPLTTSAGIWTPSGVRPIPAGTSMGVPGDVAAAGASGLFDDATIERLSAERAGRHDTIVGDVAVGDLVARRLGEQVVDRLVDPLLGGVYAGRARELSLQATMPALAAALRTTGSLVAAAALASPPRRVAPTGTDQGPPAPVFVSVRGGVARIAEGLVDQGRFDVVRTASVRAIRRTAAGFVLTVGAVPTQREVAADIVIVATPAGKSAALLAALAPDAAAGLRDIRTASVAIVSLAVPLAGLQLPAGSGLLVPASTPSVVKAVTISSQKWPGAPAGLALIRASIGRIGEDYVLQRDDAELIVRAVNDLGVLLGVPIAPVDALVTRWGGALPQYDVGHLDRIRSVRAAVARVPGLGVAGASYDGIGIPACISSARLAVDQALSTMSVRATEETAGERS